MEYLYFFNLLFLTSFDLTFCHSNFDYSFPKVKPELGTDLYDFVALLNNEQRLLVRHHVSIFNEDLAEIRGIEHDQVYCSGSLYKNRYIITSASCVDPNHRYRLYILKGTGVGQDVIGNHHIIAKIRHSDYDPITFQNDIAIIVLSYPVGSVPGVVLPYPNQPDEYIETLMAGFADTDYEHNSLYVAQMYTLPKESCQQKLQDNFYSDLMICARAYPYALVQNVNKRKDLGAGLFQVNQVSQNNIKRILLGIASNYRGNEQFTKERLPAVFTRVKNYVEWIDGIVRGFELVQPAVGA